MNLPSETKETGQPGANSRNALPRLLLFTVLYCVPASGPPWVSRTGAVLAAHKLAVPTHLRVAAHAHRDSCSQQLGGGR